MQRRTHGEISSGRRSLQSNANPTLFFTHLHQPLRSDGKAQQNDYVITMPKVFTNQQEKICLTWMDEQTRPKEEKLHVQIRDMKSNRVWINQSEPITSGEHPGRRFRRSCR